jgi:SAM-dependent methyltransferase
MDVPRTFPLINFFGRVYLTYIDELLEQQLEINPSDRVLDIGGGSRPFARADVVTEAFLEENTHRSGVPVAGNINYVECPAEELPFKDREFDLAVARHVLEHVTDPGRACREMMRVAKRGFIETPGYYNSYLSDYPAHRWIVCEEEGKLIFEKKKYTLNPFRNAVRGCYYADADHRLAMDYSFRNLACTQFYWEDSFAYEVRDHPGGYDYDNKRTAALAHLDYAMNALKYGHIPVHEVLAELATAARLDPALTLARYYKEAARLEKFSPENFAGRVFPLVEGYGEALLKTLHLKNPDNVIEFGPKQLLSGSTFVPALKVTTGAAGPPGKKKKYACSIVAGVLEKHPDPALFLRQLITLSNRGIIEVPSRMWEYFEGDPRNIWLFNIEDGRLTLHRKPFAQAPFPGVISRYCNDFPDVGAAFGLLSRNLTYIQFYWEKNIPFQVI